MHELDQQKIDQKLWQIPKGPNYSMNTLHMNMNQFRQAILDGVFVDNLDYKSHKNNKIEKW